MDQVASLDTGDRDELSIDTGDGDELSWAQVGRIVLGALAVLLVAPVAITLLLAVAWILLPVALIALPFILPGTVADGAAEHEHQREHDGLGQVPAHAR